MSRYAVEAGLREGEALVVLRDTASGVAAQLWPGCGNNCFDLTLAAPDGHPVTVIQAPPALDEIRRRPSWWGIPLLFPFPGSIPRGEYAFQGRRLRLGRPEQPIVSEGHEAPGARRDFHGFVMDLPWQVATTDADDAAATVRSTLDAADHPQTLEGFPFPFRVESTYRLDQRGLHLRFAVTNSGEGQLPFGFGAHPFFRLPLGAHGAPADCLVRIPAGRRWDGRRLRALLERDGEGEGRQTAPVPWQEVWDEVCLPVRAPFDLRTPQPFVAGAYNGAYTDLMPAEGPESTGSAGSARGWRRGHPDRSPQPPASDAARGARLSQRGVLVTPRPPGAVLRALDLPVQRLQPGGPGGTPPRLDRARCGPNVGGLAADHPFRYAPVARSGAGAGASSATVVMRLRVVGPNRRRSVRSACCAAVREGKSS